MVSKVFRNQERLAAAFKHPPEQYLFTERTTGKDRCACGQHISVRFHVRHPSGHELVLGCDCIETYTTLGAIKTQVDAFLAAEKAAEKEAVEAARYVELCRLQGELRDTVALAREMSKPVWLWRLSPWVNGRRKLNLASLKSTAGKLRKVQKELDALKAAIAVVRAEQKPAEDGASA